MVSAIAQNLCKLQYLSLDFFGFDNLNNDNMVEIASILLSNLSQLKGFSIYYGGQIAKIQDDTLMPFVMELSKYAKGP